MVQYDFTSQFLKSSINKDGTPRLRIPIKTEHYNYISYQKEVKFLRRMTLKCPGREPIILDYPRISKGTTYGKYTPHFITVSASDVRKYGFKVKEPVRVVVEWDD